MAEKYPWDKYLTEQDRSVLSHGGFGGLMGFPKRPALLVIDVSVGFCGDEPEDIELASKRYLTSCGEAAWRALPQIERLLVQARLKAIPIIYTTGDFREDGWDYGAWRWKQVKEHGDITPGNTKANPHRIVEQIAPHSNDIVILKQKPSAFFGTNLIGYLNLLKCDGLILAGCTTSGCIRATAVDAAGHNYRVTVAHDACFDRFEISHAVTLFDLHVKYADVSPTDDVLALMSTLDKGDMSLLPSG